MNLPALIEGVSLSLEEGPVVRVVGHTHGGETLRGHLDDGHVADLLTDGPDDDGWEWVILQEQSSLGTGYVDVDAGTLGAPDDFHAAARSHPTATGSYLAALVIYATVTGRSPMGAPHELRGAPSNFAEVMESEQPTVLVSLPAALAGVLQRIAAQSAGPPAPPRR